MFVLLVFHTFLKPKKHFTLEMYVKDNCALLGHYTPGSDNFLSTFRDNLSGPSLGVKNPITCFFYFFFLYLNIVPLGFTQISVRNYHYLLHKNLNHTCMSMFTTVLLVPVHHAHRDTSVISCHMAHTKHIYLGILLLDSWKLKALQSIKISGTVNPTAQRHIAEDLTLQYHIWYCLVRTY
jgi:hypothetical protein